VGIGTARHVREVRPGDRRSCAVEGFASYGGKGGFLRWWPKILLARSANGTAKTSCGTNASRCG